MKTQVLVIHGGDTFETHEEYLSFLKGYVVERLDEFKKTGWKHSLQEKLGETFDVIAPRMPNSLNAKYVEWKIWFEKILPFLTDGIILIGHSLGGIFLAKYLSENTFPKKIKGVFLVGAPFDAMDSEYTLADFILPESLDMLASQGGQIYFYYSKDDPVVPFIDMEKYKKQLPMAHFVVFENRGHFTQPEFPEIVEAIRML